MYAKIKELADEAIKLQNKDRMDAVLREISAMCDSPVADGKVVTYTTATKNPEVLDACDAAKVDGGAAARTVAALNNLKNTIKKAAKK